MSASSLILNALLVPGQPLPAGMLPYLCSLDAQARARALYKTSLDQMPALTAGELNALQEATGGQDDHLRRLRFVIALGAGCPIEEVYGELSGVQEWQRIEAIALALRNGADDEALWANVLGAGSWNALSDVVLAAQAVRATHRQVEAIRAADTAVTAMHKPPPAQELANSRHWWTSLIDTDPDLAARTIAELEHPRLLLAALTAVEGQPIATSHKHLLGSLLVNRLVLPALAGEFGFRLRYGQFATKVDNWAGRWTAAELDAVTAALTDPHVKPQDAAHLQQVADRVRKRVRPYVDPSLQLRYAVAQAGPAFRDWFLDAYPASTAPEWAAMAALADDLPADIPIGVLMDVITATTADTP